MTGILTIDWTCMGCPMQAEGTIIDGRAFYFRYRFGRATLGIGNLIADAITDPDTAEVGYGDDWQGVLELAECEALITQLLAMRLRR